MTFVLQGGLDLTLRDDQNELARFCEGSRVIYLDAARGNHSAFKFEPCIAEAQLIY